VSLIVAPGLPGSCESADWSASFDSIGWSKCLTFPYINGLNRSLAIGVIDWIWHLEGASCCEGFENISSECVEVDWRDSFIRYLFIFTCPNYSVFISIFPICTHVHVSFFSMSRFVCACL
jgi:hypothetical protein